MNWEVFVYLGICDGSHVLLAKILLPVLREALESRSACKPNIVGNWFTIRVFAASSKMTVRWMTTILWASVGYCCKYFMNLSIILLMP